MKLSELAIELQHPIRCGHAVELRSAPGRGKSTFAHWLVEELSRQDNEQWGKAELFLATQAPPDLQGYLFKGEVVYGGKTYSITDPTLPTWFICDDGQPCLAYKYGLLILDEYGKGQPDVKSASAELLLHGRIGKHYLPSGWARLALSNRQSDRSGETKQLDFVINRRVEYDVSDDLRGTIDWALDHGSPRQILAFMENAHDGKTGAPICFEAPPEKQGPWCTPRSLFMCGEYLKAKARAQGDEDKLPYDPITVETMQGYIGVPATQELVRQLVVDSEQPPYSAIVKDPDSVRVPERADAMMMVCYNLASKAEEKHLEAIIKYIARFDADFAVTFTRALLKRNNKFVAHPAMMKWAMANGTLIAQVSALSSLK